MWEWFSGNSIWILIASVVCLFLVLRWRGGIQEAIRRATGGKFAKTVLGDMNLSIVIIGGILLLLVFGSLASVALSRAGVTADIVIEKVGGWLLEHGVLILIVIVAAYVVYRFVKVLVPEIIERSVRTRGKGRHAKEEAVKRARTVSSIITSVIGIIILIMAVFIILSEIGIDVAPLLAGAGVVGIAVGFGAQSLIRDLLGGLFIIIEDQYNKGDVVKIAGIAGIVEEINLRRTILRDLDGTVHSVPNGEIKVASNYTKEWSRVNLNIPVSYNEDLDHVIKVINKVGEELAKDEVFGAMILTPPQVLRVDNFADSGIEIKVLGDTRPIKQWDVMGELRKRIKKAFDEEGIEIPWPHTKVYFGNSPPESVMLICKACNHPNLPDSRFCAKCGAPFTSPQGLDTTKKKEEKTE